MTIKKETPEINSSMEQQIMEAAEELFLDKGFALATTTEIARRVGCNQALVHYYFRTKENLFEKLFEKKFMLFTSAISLSDLEDSDLKHKLEVVISKYLEIITANPKLPFLILNEITTNPNRFENIVKKLKEQVAPILESFDKDLKREIEKGNVREISAFDLMLSILSLNIFMFIAKPMIMGIKNFSSGEFEEFVRNRKDEIIKTIWGGISIK